MSKEDFYKAKMKHRARMVDIVKQIETKEEKVKFNDLDSLTNYILAGVFDYTRKGNEEKSEIEKNNGHYPYIAFYRPDFVSMILKVQEKFKKKSFIDVGCGIGDKVILAEFFGNFQKVTGIELNTTTYHVAKYFVLNGILPLQKISEYYDFSHPTNNRLKTEREIINIDAFDYDFSKHDFIYMYSPINLDEIRGELYEKILREMPINGIVVEVYTYNHLFKLAEKVKGGKIRRCRKKWLGAEVIKKTKNGFTYY